MSLVNEMHRLWHACRKTFSPILHGTYQVKIVSMALIYLDKEKYRDVHNFFRHVQSEDYTIQQFDEVLMETVMELRTKARVRDLAAGTAASYSTAAHATSTSNNSHQRHWEE